MRAVGLCAILLAFGLARAQSSQSAGHSKGTSSATTGLEAVNGDKAKQQWIDAHPAEYAKLTGKTVSTPATTPYGAAENKEAWIQANPEAYAKMVGTQKSAPVGKAAIVEKAVVTSAAPVQRTEAEKTEWIKTHPAEYAKMGGTSKANTGAKPAEMTEAEKKAWIASHPEEYAKIAGKPATVAHIYISRADFKELSAEKQQEILGNSTYIVVDKPSTR
jgi:hypothetical protein